MTGVSNIRLRYFGFWEDRYLKEKDVIERINQWQVTFDGRDRHAVPEIIELTIVKLDQELNVTFYVRANNLRKANLYVPQF